MKTIKKKGVLTGNTDYGFPSQSEKKCSKGNGCETNKIEKCPPKVSRIGVGPNPIQQDCIQSTRTAE